ncbi:MAG: type IV toxin-antitoxin system AbiEi family antitoxin domain-containing protein [Deltaproteobacteria bacterium]|nr:type IV toxin-antitoxin system AbiEi family antitoxin domain-containing protein [Deltaproteobacteria bacterium]
MSGTSKKEKHIQRIMEQGSGVFSSRELVKLLGHRMAIQRLVQADELLPLGSGFYSTPKVDPAVAQIHIVARFYPRAVISGVSALIIHRLSDEKLDKATVDIPKETKLANRLLNVRRVAKSRFVGVVRMDYFGQKIRIYDPERSLCDAYRIDRGALFFKALKRYMREYSPNPEKIARYDKRLGTKVLPALQQELASA